MQKITPFLWLEDKAEQAADFYVSVFSAKIGSALGGKNSKILAVTHYDEASAKASGQKVGSVMTVSFQLDGQRFVAINGGPLPGGGESPLINNVSFVVDCKNQEEVDYYWEKLSAGGEEGVCGWINRDKFGVTWQITPSILIKLISDPDPKKATHAMTAMMKMKKIIIKDLKEAHGN